jgi:hypothetical protein
MQQQQHFLFFALMVSESERLYELGLLVGWVSSFLFMQPLLSTTVLWYSWNEFPIPLSDQSPP